METASPKTLVVSVVIPTYKSFEFIATTIGRTVNAMKKSKYEFEILIVDDGSADGTWEVIVNEAKKRDNVICIQLERNFGQHAATLCGLRNASGDFVVTMDDDLQHNPLDIEKLVDHLIKEKADLVIVDFELVEKSLIRRLGTVAVNRFVSRTLGKRKSIKLSAFRVFTKSVNSKVITSKNRRPYITGELLLASRDIKNLRLKHEKRFYGKSNYTFKSLSNLFIQIILNYSLLPLRLVVRLAFVLSIASIVLVVYGVDRNDLMMLWLLSSVFMIVIIAKYIEKLFLNVIFPLQYQVKNVFRNERDL
jgi:glycosyltransferase involved in cell wall biosynthesis